MLSLLRLILRDARGIARVCGPGCALRWLWCIVRTLPACGRIGNLQPADRAMGEGPFRVNYRGARALLSGEKVMSRIREIWVRDVYLGGGFLRIGPADVVVDLGANTGAFTILALAHGDRVRVVAVEPGAALLQSLRCCAQLNHWLERVETLNCFVGGMGEFQRTAQGKDQFAAAPCIGAEELIARAGLARIDFLKCDIEGSEFELLGEGSRLLAMTRQLAVELHDDAGDRQAFLRRLHEEGFETRLSHDSRNDCVVLARR